MRFLLSYVMFCIAVTVAAQVGINTTAPTTDLDINGGLRVRNLSNTNGLTTQVFATEDGTIISAASDPNSPGPRFIGFLSADLPLPVNEAFNNIYLTDELVDVLGEYDTTTGLYQPASDGTYKVSMDFDIGGYSNATYDLDILIGLWDVTDSKWVLRRTFQHLGNFSDTVNPGRGQSYGITNYTVLDSTHQYRFRILPSYDSTVTRDAALQFENTGSTGTSKSTSFSIEKVI